jgi:hypothetical protein
MDQAVLAWLLFPRQKPGPAALAKGIASLAEGDYEKAKSIVGKALTRLKALGLVAVKSPLALTEKGRRHTLEALGIEGLPRGVDFRWAKKLLVIRALGLPITSATIKGASAAGWLSARVLVEHYELNMPSDATLAQVAQALAWRALGIETKDPFNWQQAFAPILLREEKPIEKTSPAPASSDDGLERFAHDVMEAARASPTGRWHDKKVFISHVWASLLRRGASNGNTFEGFQRRLVEAHQARLVRLSRADLVEAMPPADVALSETAHLNATFHFVRIDDR